MGLKKFLRSLDASYIDSLTHAGTIGLHLVSGVAVGAVIGYFLDAWLKTDPWLFILFIIVGIAAGFRNVYLDTKRLVAAQGKDNGKHNPPQD